MSSPLQSSVLETELGKYHLITQLARGGMGNVYLAVAQGPGGFNKLVAVKELRPEFADDETYVAMFLEEARLAARLTHPNVVQTNEVGSDGDRHFMVMEYLDGRSLHRIARHLSRQKALPLGVHLRILSEALLGLHYAHELRGFDGEPLGIVHRDVSPLNVVVTFDGQTKVLDFGIAKAVDSALETRAGVLKGRAAYMSPEQALGQRVDRRADVYSAGVAIWEASAGRRLWPDMTDLEIFTRIVEGGSPSLRTVWREAPVDLDGICARALARAPEDRYPTAAALFEDLDEHLAHRDDAMPMRQIGGLVSRAFEGERQRMSALIEECLSRARSGPRSGVVQSFARVGPETGSSSISRERSTHDGIESISALLVSTPSRADAERSRPAPSVAGSPNLLAPAPGAQKRRLRTKEVAAVALTLVAASVAAAWLRGERSERVPAVDSTSPRSPVTDLPPEPERVDVVVHPLDVTLDRRPAVSPRPALAPRPPAVSVTPVRRALSYGASDPARTFPTSPATVAPSSTAPRRELDPAGGQIPLRPIVTTNPYGSP
jgi:serine/threonine protein kinase